MKSRLILLGLIIMGIALFPILYNFIVIRSRIYYIIDYDVPNLNREEIIQKIETFNYTENLNNYFEGFGELKSYVDKEFVLYLQSQIEDDTDIQWVLFYEHYLRYFFVAENHSELYLTYNNKTIFQLKDNNNQSLFSVENFDWDDIAWYLNFTQLPYVYNDNATILMNNAIFVEIRLESGYICGNLCGLWYSINQFIVLSSELDVLMLIIPHTGMVVA
ncbi:MAG: hypothetical protein HWN80_19565 [Candidatus Lokiarchaeota archaeon]|nr:hypothetical protein [Candidatus Lokiarchaeota archaeon]